jgi:hypothetical protein
MTTEQIEAQTGNGWQQFLKKHLLAFALFITSAILAFAGAVYVFVWFTGNAQSTGLVPASLGMWTMGNIVAFILNTIFWEIVLIGIPVAIGAIVAWQWWKHLPEAEKTGMTWKRSKSRNAGGAISPLLFIAFALKVFIDGNWNVAISTYTLDYVVGSMISILIWIVAIFAVPATIGSIWWIRHEMNKKP